MNPAPNAGPGWVRRALPWAFYDWANSAFATTVMAALVPVLNKELWSAGADPTVSTARLGYASALAAIVVAVLAPILGAIGDAGGVRKRFLGGFAFLGAAATAGLAFAGAGEWKLALPLFVVGWIGFAGANIFYDSLIMTVADDEKLDAVSALGYSMGYIGGALLFTLNVAMLQFPGTFGLSGAGQAAAACFLTVATWWALFTLPLLFKVKEDRPARPPGGWAIVTGGFVQLGHTFRKIRKLRAVALFLLAYWLYIDGVDTVIQMAVDFGSGLGFSSGNLMTALLITQYVGFPAALAFGRIGERLGPKAGILIALVVYVLVCFWGYRMQSVKEFYALAIIIGLVQGGVQSLSRSLYARLIPADQAGEFFGFYNMLGKFAAILGPIIMGTVALQTGNPRLGILGIIPLFVAGGLVLIAVRPPASRPS